MKMFNVLIAGMLLSLTSMPLLAGDNFRTHCNGNNEVAPVDTLGQCQANFKLTRDGTGLEFRLNVSNLEAITQAHIHIGPAGANGGAVAFLFGFVPAGTNVRGTLAKGVLTDADLFGAMTGMSIADLVAELEAGNAYVNVHTQGVPSGEVRGQIH